ncbi:rhamnan synthesis F family protein [Desulfosediminicola ganghwensis]|uniref:rhamnan synthesis F family protein n=1 Tax=Desulfosediminicola ganghwensis TaxID=2569540 RepID=UPI0010AB73A1|nr:rhamnan synthesis F family protein [Desulfosediminicola ganghwensis]
MKRLVIFAGYSEKQILHSYVIHYLNKLNEISDVIVVFDNYFNNDTIDEINKYAVKSISKHHGEYDFGSYKRGFVWALENDILKKYDSLTFCNDSVFGPLYNIEKIYNNFDAHHSCDFWGMFKIVKKDIEHIQSFYTVFKKNVFESDCFRDFVLNITKLDTRDEIVTKYEYGLSKVLHNQGYCSKGLFYGEKYSARNFNALDLIVDGFPFMKKAIFKQNERTVLDCNELSQWMTVVNRNCFEYNSEYVLEYLKNEGLLSEYEKMISVSLFRQFINKRNCKKEYACDSEYRRT